MNMKDIAKDVDIHEPKGPMHPDLVHENQYMNSNKVNKVFTAFDSNPS
eukprot:CAMPEP_0116960678 /NCGR_PEP_ID=MMETSP0467-20121206/46099_1 /TAXON_ID=283647 /ORGANISM="Mesodinium pulex, Strain SPMC105" /LENGTH=47 /DNA_ID= /DNA_START= /DNA_END= /DNA_ORIENTATION=